MREKKNRRRKLYELIADETELPSDAFARIPTVTVRGLREVEIDGCGGILEYGEERVVLACPYGIRGTKKLRIDGKQLILSDFSCGTIRVRGEIRSIDFTEE